MDDNGGIGSIIFYIILALIGLAGSFKGKKKKTIRPGESKKIFSWPDLGDSTEHSFPDVFDNETTFTPGAMPKEESTPVKTAAYTSKPKAFSPGPYDEGRYDEPMAKSYSEEGSYRNLLAERYSDEGSMADALASQFSHEGSVKQTMADAFSSEGVSSLSEAQLKMSPDNTISDTQSGGIYGYSYNAIENDADGDENFDVRKAIIYSVILDRKEYSY